MRRIFRSNFSKLLFGLLLVGAMFVPLVVNARSYHQALAANPSFPASGNLDCNGYSKIQKPLRLTNVCTDFLGYDGGRGSDNGHYIGHDEPTVNFFSNAPGAGNNMQWQVTLPKEHALPATQSFENYITFWFGMDLCDPNSFPQNPCIPDSDKNPSTTFANNPQAAGGAFLELQFYPPGFSPFISRVSCDLTHWCAAMNIDSLECNPDFSFCNPNCTEPVNFAFIQMDGVAPGPPGPASANNATFTPNNETLLMNQGDTLKVTIKDTPNGLLNRVDDLTTRQSGFIVASAKNGFQHLDLNTCNPTNFSFHPEFSTNKFGNFLSWGPGQTNISYDVEIGHFTPGRNGDNDADDPPCFKGPTVAGCLNFATGGDFDFDGSSYLPDWADGTRNTPNPILLGSVLGNGIGPVSAPKGQSNYTHPYASMQFDTEVGASETTCMPDGSGCTVPPEGATFYPFFAQSSRGASCKLTFGNDIRGATINDFGRDAQYGKPNLAWSFLDSSSGIMPNPCTPQAT